MNTPRASDWLYRGCSLLCLTFFWLAWSFRRKGQENVPSSGPLLVLANHQSFLDPVIVGLAVRRRLVFMARKSLFRHRPLAWVMSRLGAFPVDHEGPATEGVRTCLQLLKQGAAVVIFPEGSRTANGELQQLKPGTAIILRRTQVPVLPVGLAGAYQALPIWRRWPHFAPLGLPGNCGIASVVGKVIAPDEYLSKGIPRMMDDFLSELQNLTAEAERIRKKN